MNDGRLTLGIYAHCLLAFILVGLSGCSRGKVDALIKDETGAPVPNAQVKISWSTGMRWDGSGGTEHSRERVSDQDGRATFPISTSPTTFVEITKAGYYPTGVTFRSGRQRASPVIISFKRILRPQPMIGKRATMTLPADLHRFEYDLLVGDCLPPYGKGVVADLVIEWRTPDVSKGEYPRNVITVQIPGEGNGTVTQRINPDSDAARCPLLSYHEAPESGYVGSFADADQTAGGFEGTYYGAERIRYLKLRSDKGSTPLFAKVRGDVHYIPRPNDSQAEFEFEYVLNPSGDRGMEIDMKRITIPTQHRLEYAPDDF